jgi:rhamnose utilization protein RhaD (predicted bifunctional aldolase and dehydrogenase)
MKTRHEETQRALIALSHELGAEHRQLAILGEGNTSAKLDNDSFLVKASGGNLGTLSEAGVVECRFAPLLAMLDRPELSDEQIDHALFASRVDPGAKKPSVEALFHAYLLSLPGVGFVGHVHSVAVNQLLCSPRARDFAGRRLFPDEVVCCGTASVFVPYTDPGLKLAVVIRQETASLIEGRKAIPRIILLESHGLIAFGASPEAVKAAVYMADKAARIFVGALAAGGPNFLEPAQVDRIASRLDEHYRQRALNL